ncbi:MAG: hypothetical protein R3E53_14460 [Myxococcota bacterium]
MLFSTALPMMQKVPDLAARFGVAAGRTRARSVPRPADRVVAALAFHGVRWHLFDDPPDEAIRFVISGDPLRSGPLRDPLPPARADLDPGPARDRRGQGRRHDPRREPRRRLPRRRRLRQRAGGGRAALRGRRAGGRDPCRIAWAVEGTTHAGNIRGVSFLEVDPEAGRVLDALRDAVIARNRISKPG